MHPTGTQDLARFCRPYLSIEDGTTFREGRFQIREGRSQKRSKEVMAAELWIDARGQGPRPEKNVVKALEAKIDNLTAEGHQKVWIVAFYSGEKHPSAWYPVADAELSAEARAESPDLPRPAKSIEGGMAQMAWVLNQTMMHTQDQNQNLIRDCIALTQQLGDVRAELSAAYLVLEASKMDNTAEAFKDTMKELGPAIGPAIARIMETMAGVEAPDGIPEGAGDQMDYHIDRLSHSIHAIAALAQANRELMTDDRKVKLGELYQLITAWFGA
jgi:hypothetical protein